MAQAGVGDVASFGYDPADRLVSAGLANQVGSAYNYDDNDRLTGLTHTRSGGPTLFDKSFGYDAVGNRLWSRNNLAAEGDLSELYGYDGLDRLIGFGRGTLNGSNDAITGPPPVDHLASRNWPAGSGLDKRGNWLNLSWSIQRSGSAESHTETRTPNGVNEYLTRQVDSDPAVNLVCDAAGNLTDDGQFGFTYDAENRLVSVTDNATQTELLHVTYDALGRAIERTTQAGTIRYVYDAPGGAGASGYAVLQEYDDTGSLLREFVHAAGHTQPLAMIDYTDAGSQPAGVAETFYYLLDERGSVTAITDSGGEVVESYRYDAYGGAYVYDGTGALIASWLDNWNDAALTPSPVGNPYGFTGHRFSVAGLYETPFRAYSPYLGRWLQRDPLGYVDGVNLYQYVYGDPIGWLDLFGLHGVHLNPMGVVLDLAAMVAVSSVVAGDDYDPFEESQKAADAINKKHQDGLAKIHDVTGDVIVAVDVAIVGGVLVITVFTPGPDELVVAGALGKAGRAAAGAAKAAKGAKKAKGIQRHHVLSKRVLDALERHPKLKGRFKRSDKGFTTKGKQKGYEKWHRDLDKEIEDWLESHPEANEEDFLKWLRERYNKPDLRDRFPDMDIPKGPKNGAGCG